MHDYCVTVHFLVSFNKDMTFKLDYFLVPQIRVRVRQMICVGQFEVFRCIMAA